MHYVTYIFKCVTHDADCSVEPVSAGRSDSVYQELTSPTTAGSPADKHQHHIFMSHVTNIFIEIIIVCSGD